MLRILAEMIIRFIIHDRFPSLKVVKLIDNNSSGFAFHLKFSEKATPEKMYPAEIELYNLTDNGRLPLAIKIFSPSFRPDKPIHETALSIYNSISYCENILPVLLCGKYCTEDNNNSDDCLRYIITPYCPITLYDAELSEQECIELTVSICNALIEMHNRAEYTHGNISMDNIFIDYDSGQYFLGGYENACPVEDILYGAQLDLPVTDIQKDIRALGECMQEFLGEEVLCQELPDFKKIIDKALGVNGSYTIAEEMIADLTALQSRYWIEMPLEHSAGLFFNREDKGMAVAVLQEILRDNILGNPVIISGADDFDNANIIDNFFKEYEFIHPDRKSICINTADVSDEILKERYNMLLIKKFELIKDNQKQQYELANIISRLVKQQSVVIAAVDNNADAYSTFFDNMNLLKHENKFSMLHIKVNENNSLKDSLLPPGCKTIV